MRSETEQIQVSVYHQWVDFRGKIWVFFDLRAEDKVLETAVICEDDN